MTLMGQWDVLLQILFSINYLLTCSGIFDEETRAPSGGRPVMVSVCQLVNASGCSGLTELEKRRHSGC